MMFFLHKTKQGTIDIPLPDGFRARIIYPDGKYGGVTHIRLVPSGDYVKTVYPLAIK